jgi:protein phosphatase
MSFAQCHQGRVRPYNEDAVLDLSDEGVWVVADGMGGHSAGDVASQMVIDVVRQSVAEAPAGGADVDCLRQALLNANQQILDYSQQYLEGKTVGSTVVLLLIRNGLYHCLWAGDSRIYLMRERQLHLETRDHSQVMDMVEQGQLRAEEAESHPLSNVITRAIGVNADLCVDHVSGSIRGGDQFLLCSDGLTKELSDADLAKCMHAYSVLDTGQALIHSALVKGARDNVSCVLVKVASHDTAEISNNEDDTVPVFNRRG